MANGNHRFVYLSLSVLLSGLWLSCEKKKIESDREKIAYALGQQIAKNLKGEHIDFDAKVLARSIKDTFTQQPSLLKPEEMMEALKQVRDSQQQKLREESDHNLKKTNEFLEKNKTLPGIQVSSSGLQYQILEPGKGVTLKEPVSVKLNYTGSLIDGRIFDSSTMRGESVQFKVAEMIKGLAEGALLLKPAGKAKIFIPPELGYGAKERPGIPAHSVLIYEIELLETKP